MALFCLDLLNPIDLKYVSFVQNTTVGECFSNTADCHIMSTNMDPPKTNLIYSQTRPLIIFVTFAALVALYKAFLKEKM